jgi:hypothetical protein
MCKLHIYQTAGPVKANVQTAHMIRAIDALLAPIARLFVARGVGFAEATRHLKRHYVQAALALAGRDATDSRISVMTGLQRRDVVALRAAQVQDAPTINHTARLVARWLAQHKGAPLPRKGYASFDALALSIRRDVHPKTLLDQLVEAGTVTLDADGTVHLAVQAHQPRTGGEEQLAYLANNAGDFLNAAVANTLLATPPHFERAVHYNQLSPSAVAQLDAAFRAGQMALLHDINARAAALQGTDPGTARFRAGGYFYTQDDRE